MSAGRVCSIHGSHRPVNETLEDHHVIPVAWQLHTAFPPDLPEPSPGPDTERRGMLWDDRTVTVCPTGHRNVHYWIVRLMHAAHEANTQDPAVALSALRSTLGRRRPAELAVAALALERFAPFGQLAALIAAGEWGES